ncbi:MAG TPA: hypothetical protein VF008_27025 [Niastella sp.]
MPGASIYRLYSGGGYLMHAYCKTKSGFHIACDPFTRIQKADAVTDEVVNAIKASLNTDDSIRLPDPQDWSEFDRIFLQKCGLKTARPLKKLGTFLVEATKKEDILVFQPTKRAEDANYIPKDMAEAEKVPFTASNEQIIKALDLAFSKCE